MNFSLRDTMCSSQYPVGSNKCSSTGGKERLQRNLPWPAVWTGFFSIYYTVSVGLVAGYTAPKHLHHGVRQTQDNTCQLSSIDKSINNNKEMGVMWTHQLWHPGGGRVPIPSLIQKSWVIMQSYLWAAVQTTPDAAWEFSHIFQVVSVPVLRKIQTSENQRK